MTTNPDSVITIANLLTIQLTAKWATEDVTRAGEYMKNAEEDVKNAEERLKKAEENAKKAKEHLEKAKERVERATKCEVNAKKRARVAEEAFIYSQVEKSIEEEEENLQKKPKSVN